MATNSSLTIEQKAEMLQYLQDNGTDFDNILTNPVKADWENVAVPLIDMRDPMNVVTVRLDLKSVLDVYGVDVEALSRQVINNVKHIDTVKGQVDDIKTAIDDAEGRIYKNPTDNAEKRIGEAEQRITGVGGAEERVGNIEKRVKGYDSTYLGYKDAAGKSASNASSSEQNAARSEETAINQATEAKGILAQVQALLNQVEVVSSSAVHPLVSMGGDLYQVTYVMKHGKTYHILEKVEPIPAPATL